MMNIFVIIVMLSAALCCCAAALPVNISSHLSTSTLYSVHDTPFEGLLGNGSCSVSQVNLVARHGARFPTNGSLTTMLSLKQHLHSRCRHHKLNSTFKWLATWSPNFDPRREGQLTQTGIAELNHLGQRFAAIFSQSLGTYDPATIRIRSTEKSRAGRSASAFAYGAWNSRIHSGKRYNPPFIVTTGPLDDDPLLRFFKTCPLYQKSKEAATTLAPAQQWMQRFAGSIISKINAKVGSNLFEEAHIGSIWNTCKYELTALGVSRMCDLLDYEDVQNLEIVDDIEIYWQKGYGVPLNYHMACPLANDIANSIAAAAAQTPLHYKADLRFAHAETVLPLLALLGLYKDNFNLDENTTLSQMNARKWRSSSISPFSTNLAFVLYDCHNGSQFVSVFHNERLRTLSACGYQQLCPLHTFLQILRPHQTPCQLKTMCSLSNASDADSHAAEPFTSSRVIPSGALELILGLFIGAIFGRVGWQVWSWPRRGTKDYQELLRLLT